MSAHYKSPILSGWIHHAGDAWTDYTQHVFVNTLADGTLDRSVFMQYLIQDYLFLLHYSRAWAMAVVKADGESEMRTSAAIMNALINEEIQLHVGVCQREGISVDDLNAATEAVENLSYTRYAMDAALSGDLADLLAVLAPCMFGYGEIGLRLAASRDNTAPLYREWIDAYCGDEYQQVCVATAELLESAIYHRLGDDPESNPRWPGLCQRFLRATELEADFWSMGYRLANVPIGS